MLYQMLCTLPPSSQQLSRVWRNDASHSAGFELEFQELICVIDNSF